jgi:glucosamine-6-phosphate deaminase
MSRNPYTLEFDEFSKLKPWRFSRVPDPGSLNRLVVEELVSKLKGAAAQKKKLMVICPVGPLDYSFWVKRLNQEQIDGSFLVTVNMDEYLNKEGGLLEELHPLSFRKFMRDSLFNRLRGKARIPDENIYFPSPDAPERTTELIQSHGGADVCYGGFGLTGHFAFNDPPAPSEPCDDDEVRNSRTRVVTICPESQAQMCMGGTAGNWEIIPKRAVTLGMYELMLSKKIHLTFMRSWHAGVLRRALFGEVSGRCPGSFIQEHPDVEVTMTELAATVPPIYVAQGIGL